MKITKGQLRRIIKEVISEAGKPLPSDPGPYHHDPEAPTKVAGGFFADDDPRLEDRDDLSLGEETLEKMVTHLRALNDLVTSEAGQRTIGGKKEARQIEPLLRWAEDYLTYWKS